MSDSLQQTVFSVFVAGKIGEVVDAFACTRLQVPADVAQELRGATTEAAQTVLRAYARRAPRDILGRIMEEATNVRAPKRPRVTSVSTNVSADPPPLQETPETPFEVFLKRLEDFFVERGARFDPALVTHECEAWAEFVEAAALGVARPAFTLRDPAAPLSVRNVRVG